MMQCFWVYMTSKKECTIFLMFHSPPCVCDCMHFNVYCNTVNHLDQLQYNNLHCYMPVILNVCFTWLPFLFWYCFQVTHVGTLYVRVWLHLRLLILIGQSGARREYRTYSRQCKWYETRMQCFWVYMASPKDCTIFLMLNSSSCVCDCRHINVYWQEQIYIDHAYGYLHVVTWVRVWPYLRLYNIIIDM
jgi:hypothetical protein